MVRRGRAQGPRAETTETGALHALLDPSALRRAAGAASYRRGEDYAAEGKVCHLAEDAGKLVAEVQGTTTYRVALWAQAGRPARSAMMASSASTASRWGWPGGR
jgi:uncharacterized Zn finger protein